MLCLQELSDWSSDEARYAGFQSPAAVTRPGQPTHHPLRYPALLPSVLFYPGGPLAWPPATE